MHTEVIEDFVECHERRSKFWVYLNVKLSYINILSKGLSPNVPQRSLGEGAKAP